LSSGSTFIFHISEIVFTPLCSVCTFCHKKVCQRQEKLDCHLQ